MWNEHTVIPRTVIYEQSTEDSAARHAAVSRLLGNPDAAAARHPVFSETLLENAKLPRPRRTADLAGAFAFQGLILAALILVPLWHTAAIDLGRFNATYLIAPAPPAPPPPPAAGGAPRPTIVRKSAFDATKLTVPTVIPKDVVVVKDQAPGVPVLDAMNGVSGGVAGGVPGGQIGGVLGGVFGGAIGGATQVVPPVPPPTAPARPYQVGGLLRRPRLITQVEAQYPPLAKQARIQGDVLIDAIIDTEGNVSSARVISGNPLLIQAALDAVRHWKYEPTLLNGLPVAVELQAVVQFQFK
jgi:periplasmic protein TonB